MAGSTIGNIFKITTWGESHGNGIGVVIDGCPAGLPLDQDTIQEYLDRRKPGQSVFSTPRKESDKAEILSGVFEGRTTGTSIAILVRNENQKSGDYSKIASYYRPGHADFTFDSKYGFRDYRGGGRSSGRETIGRVAGGAVACQILKELGISILAYSKSIGPVTADPSRFSVEEIPRNPLYMPDPLAAEEASSYLKTCMDANDSAGGVVECIISGVPAGIGEPVFEKLDANLAKAIFSIGAVKGFEIGSGFESSKMLGSENNDSFLIGSDKKITKETNHSGGCLGGISDGSPIIFRAAVKPTPSISRTQQTVTRNGEPIEVSIGGRHDPVVVPRAVVVVETMAAITLTDLLLMNMGAKMDHLKKIYE